MPFKLTCLNCGQQLEAEDEWVGLESECPHCGKTCRIEKPVPSKGEDFRLDPVCQYRFEKIIRYSKNSARVLSGTLLTIFALTAYFAYFCHATWQWGWFATIFVPMLIFFMLFCVVALLYEALNKKIGHTFARLMTDSEQPKGNFYEYIYKNFEPSSEGMGLTLLCDGGDLLLKLCDEKRYNLELKQKRGKIPPVIKEHALKNKSTLQKTIETIATILIGTVVFIVIPYICISSWISCRDDIIFREAEKNLDRALKISREEFEKMKSFTDSVESANETIKSLSQTNSTDNKHFSLPAIVVAPFRKPEKKTECFVASIRKNLKLNHPNMDKQLRMGEELKDAYYGGDYLTGLNSGEYLDYINNSLKYPNYAYYVITPGGERLNTLTSAQYNLQKIQSFIMLDWEFEFVGIYETIVGTELGSAKKCRITAKIYSWPELSPLLEVKAIGLPPETTSAGSEDGYQSAVSALDEELSSYCQNEWVPHILTYPGLGSLKIDVDKNGVHYK